MTVLSTAALIAAAPWGPGPWWPVFPLFWLVVWATVLFVAIRFWRGGRWQHRHTAEEVLAERYARGEISVEEYRERRRVLQGRAS